MIYNRKIRQKNMNSSLNSSRRVNIRALRASKITRTGIRPMELRKIRRKVK